MQPVVIMRGRAVVALGLVVSGIVAMLIWAISFSALSFYTVLPFEARVIVSIAFVCFFWIWLVRHLSLIKPALLIDDRGIVDNAASDYGVGLIPWSEITGAKIDFRYTRAGTQKVLAISVRDLESLMAQMGIIARTVMRLEKRLSLYPGSVIDIPQRSLRTPVEEVLSSIQQHWHPSPRSGMAAEPERSASRAGITNLSDQIPRDPFSYVMLLIFSLALYGPSAWYFPNAAFATVAAIPAVAFSIAGAHRLRLWIISKLAFLLWVTLGALMLWSAFVQGLPAVVTHLLGASGAEVAVIGVKKKTQKSGLFCGYYQLSLVDYCSSTTWKVSSFAGRQSLRLSGWHQHLQHFIAGFALSKIPLA